MEEEIVTFSGVIPACEGAILTFEGTIPTLEGVILTSEGVIPALAGAILNLVGTIPGWEGVIPTFEGVIPAWAEDKAAFGRKKPVADRQAPAAGAAAGGAACPEPAKGAFVFSAIISQRDFTHNGLTPQGIREDGRRARPSISRYAGRLYNSWAACQSNI